jgi:hypothetical protein
MMGLSPKSTSNFRQLASNHAVRGWCHRSLLSLAPLLLLAVLPVCGQQNTPITLNVNAVNLLASVRDKHANIVSNLTKDDFVLEQDGKPQTIAYFAKESELPLTLGLLVDTSKIGRAHV